MKHLTNEQIWQLLAGDLDKDLGEEYQEHLDNCSLCKKSYEEEQSFNLLLSNLPRESPSIHFAQGVIAKLKPVKEGALHWSAKAFPVILCCSCICAAIFATVLFAREFSAATSNGNWVATMGNIAFPVIVILSLVLLDLVWSKTLNGDPNAEAT